MECASRASTREIRFCLNSVAVYSIGLLFILTLPACDLFKTNQHAEQTIDKPEGASEESHLDELAGQDAAAIIASTDDSVSAKFSADSATSQFAVVEEGTRIVGSFISMPPGALEFETHISMMEGESLTTPDVLGSLGFGGAEALVSLAPAVSVFAETSVDPLAPFSLAIPMPTESFSLLEGESVADDNEIYVFYNVHSAANKKNLLGVIPPGQLRKRGNFVLFESSHFGSFQSAYVAKNKEVAAKEVETDKKIKSIDGSIYEGGDIVTVEEQVPPANPTDLAINETTAESLKVTWTPGDPNTALFRMAFQVGAIAPADCNTGTTVSSATLGTNTSYTISNLHSDTEYALRICAVGAAGDLAVSSGATISGTTLEAPPLPPTDLTVTVDSSSSVTVNWNSGGGTTVGYKIAYAVVGSAPANCSAATDAINDITATTQTIPDLDLAANRYAFALCAYNGNAVRDYSTSILRSQPAVAITEPVGFIKTGLGAISVSGSCDTAVAGLQISTNAGSSFSNVVSDADCSDGHWSETITLDSGINDLQIIASNAENVESIGFGSIERISYLDSYILAGDDAIDVVDITRDSQGNVYLGGTFNSSAASGTDFKPGVGEDFFTSVSGTIDSFITKLGSDMSYEWTVVYGGNNNDFLDEIAVGSDGSVYVCGSFNSTDADFDPSASDTATAASGFDGYVAKYNSSGSFQWVQTFSSASSESVKSLVVQSVVNGNVFVLGDFGANLDIDGVGPLSFTGAGDTDMFLAKLDSSDGSIVDGVQIGGDDYQNAVGLALDETLGKLYLLYNEKGLTTFYDVGEIPSQSLTATTTDTLPDAAIVEVNPVSLVHTGHWTIGASGAVNAQSIALNESGDLFIGGKFAGSIDFQSDAKWDPSDSNKTAGGDNDGFVVKVTKTGSWGWVHVFASATDKYTNVLNLAAGTTGLYVGGYIDGETDFDPGNNETVGTTGSDTDGYVAKLDFDGDFQSVRGFVGSGWDQVSSLSVGPYEILTVGGYIGNGAIDFDPGAGSVSLSGDASYDGFFTHYAQ